MINNGTNNIYEWCKDNLKKETNSAKKFIYKESGYGNFLYKERRDFSEKDIENVSLNNKEKIKKIIDLGIKKGWIYRKNGNWEIINDKKGSDFQNFLRTVKNNYGILWEAVSEADINNNSWKINKSMVDCCQDKNYRNYYSEVNKYSQNDVENLIKHIKYIDPVFEDSYKFLLAVTLVLGNSETNKLSKIVREYLKNKEEQRKEILELFIAKMCIEMKEIDSSCIIERDISLPEDLVDEKGELNEILKNVKSAAPKLRCFIHNDFYSIENSKEMKYNISKWIQNLKDNEKKDNEIKNYIKFWKLFYDYENYEGAEDIIDCDDKNIDQIREKFGKNGLHFVVGDLHGGAKTLEALLKKIKYDKEKDYLYFVGDYYYSSDGDVDGLLETLKNEFEPDYSKQGFHIIKGNHDNKKLSILPDIIVIRMEKYNFYIAHAAVYNKVIDAITLDMQNDSKAKVFMYQFDNEVINADNKEKNEAWKCYKMTCSEKGNFVPEESDEFIQDTRNSLDDRACIIHGHTPYFYFNKKDYYKKYGNNSLFWEKQHIWFGEDMRSFDIDANIKDKRHQPRGLSCICLEVYDNLDALTKKNILQSENGAFFVEHIEDANHTIGEEVSDELRNKIKNIDYKIITVEDEKIVIKTKN